jgi:hypothetical protein
MFFSKETLKQQPLRKIFSLKKNFFEDDSIAVEINRKIKNPGEKINVFFLLNSTLGSFKCIFSYMEYNLKIDLI